MSGFHMERAGSISVAKSVKDEASREGTRKLSAKEYAGHDETGELADTSECDKIYMSDGSSVDARIEEITDTHVRYRKCPMKDGPLFSVSHEKIEKIVFRDGSEYVPDIPEEPKAKEKTPEEKKLEEYKEERKKEANEAKLERIEKRQTGKEINIAATLSWVAGIIMFIPATIVMHWIFIPAMLFFLLSLILGAKGIGRKRMGLGIAALVISIIFLTACLIAFIVAF